MKRYLIVSLFALFVVMGVANHVAAQSYETGDPYLMEKITNRLSEELYDIPVSIRRAAVYKINYSANSFTTEEVEYIRGEIEAAFRQHAGITILSPPELEPNDKMKIVGSDSSLKIVNVRGRSLADVTPEMLSTITGRYGVQGLIELTLQRSNPEGIIVSIRMVNPGSREIIWTKSFVSNEKVAKIEVDKGKTSVFNFGAGIMTGETDADDVIVDFSASYTFRQPINSDNSGYLGFTIGGHLLKPRAASEFEMNLLELGLTFYHGMGRRIEAINDERVAIYLNTSAYVVMGDVTGQMFNARPGLMFNFGENLGVLLYSNILLSGETVTLEDDTEATFNTIGYGIQGVVRF